MSKVLELQITCPRCNTEFESQGHTLVDFADEADSEVIYELQEGSINLARCPNCGASGLIPVPVILNHPERELLLAFVPNANEMNEEQVTGVVGPMLESYISTIPAERQADYMFEPVVTDDPMALVMAARGESLDEEFTDEDENYEGGEEDEELSPEDMAAIQERQQLLQNLLMVDPNDSLGRISLLRNYGSIVDDLFTQLLDLVTDQAHKLQPEAVPVLNKIRNEVEVFLASK